MGKISIIVPIYNAENYLRQCINSILEQTYSNLEIILVDDGAEDKSGEICDELEKTDDRIKVIHVENGGVSRARNIGLENATGEYIMFIDADDFYEKNSCEILYNTITQNDADFVVGNYINTTANGEKWEDPIFSQQSYDNFWLSVNDHKKSFYVMNSVVWNKIFKREFIEKNNFRFKDGMIAEDAIFSISCYFNSDKAYYTNEVVYNYRQNKDKTSITTTCSKEYFLKINETYQMLYSIFEKKHEMGFFRYYYARIAPHMLCRLIDTNSLKGREEEKEIIEKLSWFFALKKEYKIYITNKYLRKIINDIAETKKYRESLTDIQKERMYIPSRELYKEMPEY